MSGIKIDYNNAISKSGSIADLAGEMGKIQADLDSLSSLANNAWKGEAKNQYAAAGANLQNKVAGAVNEIRALAMSIENAAIAFRRGDEQTQEGYNGG